MPKMQESDALRAFKATKLRVRKNVGAIKTRTAKRVISRNLCVAPRNEATKYTSDSGSFADSYDTSASSVMPLLLIGASELIDF